MKFVADQSADVPIVNRLRRDGHGIISVADEAAGVDDDEVLATALREGAVLLTADKDFGEVVFLQRRATHGVFLIRLAGLSNESKALMVSAVIREHGPRLFGNFTVISPGLLRIRPNIW